MPEVIPVEVLTIDELAPAVTEHFDGVPHPFRAGAVAPDGPGVYLWASENRVLYIGKARSLTRRLGDEREWVSTHNPATHWHYTVIHLLKLHAATASWIVTADEDDAVLLERRLIEWHRACVGMAPLAVGWEAKDDGRPHGRFAAQRWARRLWDREFSR